jgi:hypothetical protein
MLCINYIVELYENYLFLEKLLKQVNKKFWRPKKTKILLTYFDFGRPSFKFKCLSVFFDLNVLIVINC